MKKIIAWIVGVSLFAGMIAGATAIYNRYLEENKPSNIVVLKGNEDGVGGGGAIPPFLQQGNQTGATTKGAATDSRSSDEVSTVVLNGSDTETLQSESASASESKLHDSTESDPHEGSEKQSPSEDTEPSQSAQESASEADDSDLESLEESGGGVVTEEIVEDPFEEITETDTEKATEKQTEKETEKETETEYVSPYRAPDFTFYDVNGNEVHLSDFRGKPIVLNFWSSGCGPCRNEMPHFQDAYDKYGDEVVFLMINCVGFFGETVSSGSSFIKNNGYTFPVYYDTENNAVGVFISNSLPYTFFIDREFDLYTYIPGMADYESLETCIGWILE